MSTAILPCESLLTPAEKADLDAFCRDHPGVEALPALAEFLRAQA